MTTLRYIGERPTTFSDFRIGMVETGDVFGVPDDQAEAYTRRADIEVVGEPEATAEAPEEPQGDPEPEVVVAEPEPADEAPETAPEPAVADTEASDVAPDTDATAQ